MTMPPRLRKFVRTAHVTTSIGWLGAVVAWMVIVPLALASAWGIADQRDAIADGGAKW